MARITWNGAAGDDNFFTAGNWIGGVVPGALDDAIIAVAVTVAANGNGSVNSLTLGAKTIVDITGDFTIAGAVTATDATGTSTNDGLINVGDNTTVSLDGTLAGTGTLALASAGNLTDLVVGPSGATFAGGGTISLGDAINNRIFGQAGTDVLINASDTIEGSGQLGAGQLTLDNQSVVAATGSTIGLHLDALTTNTGTLRATGAAGLVIQSTVTDTGGIIDAAGGPVVLENADIIGGTLVTSPGEAIENASGYTNTIDGSAGGVTNSGSIVLEDNSTLNIAGTIGNAGTIDLASAGNLADLVLVGSLVTLDGGGTVLLTGTTVNDRIYGASGADVLVNVDNTIEGFGQLGAGQLTLTNKSLVDATGAKIALIVDAATTNTGTLEATGAAGLLITGTVENAGGTIEAIGNGVAVNLQNADIVEGVFATASGGAIISDSGYTNTIDDAAGGVVSSGSLVLQDNSTLNVVGTIDNTGTISLVSAGNLVDLVAAGSLVTLDGRGVVSLAGTSVNDRIYGQAASDVLVNVDNTIEGFGQLGAGQLTFTNQSLVDATGSATALYVNAAVTNTGTIEATGTAGLVIESTVANAGGTIEAIGKGVPVNLQNADLVGGLLATASGGVIENDSGTTNTLDGSTAAGAVSNGGSLVVEDNSTLNILGTIDDTGTISLDSAGNLVDLVLAGSIVTLDGGGTVALGGLTTNDRIFGQSGSDALVNDDTIEGFGQVGAGQLTLVNNGKIIADGDLDLNATLTKAGSLVIVGAGSELEINPADLDGSVSFAGTDGTLRLDTPNSFAATIAGFAQGDVIALVGDTATAAKLDGTTLAITLNTGATLDYALAAAIPGAIATVSPFSGGTDVEIVGGAPCYAAGTRILTTRGEIAVEDLKPGDQVVTVRDGSSRPVVWLGRRRVHCASQPDRALADPVRVLAGAFGDAPTRDLLLSPDHAVWIDGVLVPIHLLVDDETIIREQHATIVYHHVELDRHDVILAEGLPAESYLDTGNRSRFANAALVVLHPEYPAESGAGDLCAPMVLDGPRLDRIRLARIAACVLDVPAVRVAS